MKALRAVAAGHICLDITPLFPGDGSLAALRPGALANVGPAQINTGGSVANTGLALRLRLRSLHTLGLLILVLGVLRLVGYDLARLGLIYKMVALLVLAGASLLISRWYRRLQAKTSSLDPAAPQAPKVERVAALPPLTLAKEGPALEPAPIEGTLRVTAPIPKLEGSPKVSEGAEAAAELLAKMPDPQAPEVGFKPLEPPQPSRPFSSQAATAEEEPASQESLATTPQPAQPAHPFTQALQKRESGEEGQSPL